MKNRRERPFLDNEYSSYGFYKAGICNRHFLTNTHDLYKGYPSRSFIDGGYTVGFNNIYLNINYYLLL